MKTYTVAEVAAMKNPSRKTILETGLRTYLEDPSKRCRGEGECYYSGETASKPNSPGCMIGQFLSPEDRLKADGEGTMSVFAVINRAVRLGIQLPTWMNSKNECFLRECQELHDYKYNWNGEGLTAAGQERLQYIKNAYL